MKKFKFQLAAVLKVTEIKKDQAEVAFADASTKLEQEKKHLVYLNEELEQGLTDYREMTQGKVTVELLRSYGTYFEHKRSQISEQHRAIEQAELHKQEKMQLLQDAMNRLKSIEQLREKRFAEFMAGEMAEEQKNLDELGIQIYMRTAR